jgi:hypothetical protein
MREKLPFEWDVSCKYGAPMGRRSDSPETLYGRVHLRRVTLVDGDYDKGGAYWGGYPSPPLFCAWTFDNTGERVASYVRAASREQAKAQFPNATFYR